MYPVISVYFDGDCPLCSREMAFIKSRDKSNRIALVDISDPNFSPPEGLPPKDILMAKIHAITHYESGPKLIVGVDVFREVYSRIGLGFILYPTKLPILKQLTDLAYIIFAKNRLRISKLFGYCVGKCEINL